MNYEGSKLIDKLRVTGCNLYLLEFFGLFIPNEWTLVVSEGLVLMCGGELSLLL